MYLFILKFKYCKINLWYTVLVKWYPFMDSWNQYHNEDIEQFHHPHITPLVLSLYSQLLLWPLLYGIIKYFFPIYFPLECPTNGIISLVTFETGFFLLSIMHFRYIHIVVSFYWWLYFIVCMHHSLLIHSLKDIWDFQFFCNYE